MGLKLGQKCWGLEDASKVEVSVLAEGVSQWELSCKNEEGKQSSLAGR